MPLTTVNGSSVKKFHTSTLGRGRQTPIPPFLHYFCPRLFRRDAPQDEAIVYFPTQNIPTVVLHDLRYLSFHRTHAVPVEVRGRYGRQGHRYRRPCRDVFLRRPLLRAHGPAAGHPAGLADDVWQPRRAARAPSHEICRHLPTPHHAALHRPARLRGRRGVLFSEQHHPPLAGQDVHPAQLRARQVARARDPRKHLLQPDLRLQRVRQEERPRRPTAPPDDLRLLRRIQQRASHRGRLRTAESLHR